MIKGLKRILDTCPTHTMPITSNILQKIYSKTNGSNQLHVILWAAFLLAFYDCPRKSSLLPPNAASFCISKHLSWGSFMKTKKSIIVNCRGLKHFNMENTFTNTTFTNTGIPTLPCSDNRKHGQSHTDLT